MVQRFGRFPHRNRELGRDTTPIEQAFLEADGFGGSHEKSQPSNGRGYLVARRCCLPPVQLQHRCRDD
jgi:hypothetical protein